MDKTVVIAVGHGGKDSGATANGLREKDITLPTSLFCEEYLNENHTGHRTLLTRRSDEFVSLNAQVQFARDVSADYVVDVHYNHFYLERAHGFETFISTSQLTEQNKRAQSKVHGSVMDLWQDYNIHDRGMKRSRHYVITQLGNTNINAVLVEGLFLSNRREANLISDPEVQKKVGYAIGRGIADFLELPEKNKEHNWDDLEMPEVARPVGVELVGKKLNEIGFLARDPVSGRWQTYLRAGFTGGLPRFDVSGHGNHVKINPK